MNQPAGKIRWTVVALLFFATTINYIDRQVLGLLKPVLEKEFNWTETTYSRIVMAFTAAYAIGLVVFGWFIDRIGTKLGYVISIIIWSVAAMLHSLVRTSFGFGLARALLGLGESGNFPAAIKSVAEWFPKKERALATGIFNSGANIGAVLAPPIVYALQRSFGWRSAFIWTGALGFLWLLWWWYQYEIPQKHRKLSAEELNYINSDDEPGMDTKPMAWLPLMGIKQTWAFICGKFLTDPIWWFFLFWLPSWLSTRFQVDLKANLGLPIIIIYTATSLGSIGGGWLSSWMIKKGVPVFRARKTALLIFAICVVPIFLIRFLSDIWLAVALVSLAAAAHQAWSANIYTTVSDMFPKKAVSSVIGIGGMAGALGGVLFPLVVGNILEYYKTLGNINAGYNILFLISAVTYLIAWILIHILAPRMERVGV